MVTADARVLIRLLRGQPRHGTHRDRLEGFYAPQAGEYDQFRERLLHGRRQMLEHLCLAPGQHVVELGCGTARNLDYLEPGLRAGLARIDAIDLCPSLLDQARNRCGDWSNVRIVESDAAAFDPGRKVDRVFLSYALTMMPDWRAVLCNAVRMLRPGGLLGIVDFCPVQSGAAHARAESLFWRRWFGHDGVWIDDAHGAFLDGLCERVMRFDGRAKVPYLPVLRVPYYYFIGRK